MSMAAENARAVIGHNNPPIDDAPEKRPPKSERIVSKADAEVFRVTVKMLAARCGVAKKSMVEKRKGGEDGRAIRCIAIGYMRGLGFPVWKLEMMWDLNRKQIGQEEEAFVRMRAFSSLIDRNMDRLETMLDAALAVELDFIPEASDVIDNILAERRQAKKASKVERTKPRPPPPPRKPLTEADILLAKNQRERKLAQIQREIAIAMAVIRKGAEPKASKDAKQDAIREGARLNELVAARDALLKPSRRIRLVS